jgi:hypothetical protein
MDIFSINSAITVLINEQDPRFMGVSKQIIAISDKIPEIKTSVTITVPGSSKKDNSKALTDIGEFGFSDDEVKPESKDYSLNKTEPLRIGLYKLEQLDTRKNGVRVIFITHFKQGNAWLDDDVDKITYVLYFNNDGPIKLTRKEYSKKEYQIWFLTLSRTTPSQTEIKNMRDNPD